MATAGHLDVEHLHWLQEGQGRLRIHLDVPAELTASERSTAHEILTRTSTKVLGRVGAKGPVTDIVGTYWGVYLMSERMVSFLTQHNVSGWRAVPVEIGNDSTLEPLWLLVITGTTGPVYGVHDLRREELPALGYFLDPTEWDGSDLFVPANTSEILVVPACAAMLKKARLRNLRLEPVGLEVTPWSSG
jgi:hypothetical protein